MEKILSVEHLDKDYGNHRVVNDVSFCLEKGKIYGLLGPNGAGKTTIMKILINSVKKTHGNIECGSEIKFNYLMDVPRFYEYMKVEEYLTFLVELNKVEDITQKVNSLLDIASLQEHRDKKIRQLSRGLRQKLGIASVLVNDCDILILDEPVSALDPIARKEVLDLIKSLKGQMCVVFSSHILEDIEKVCDAIILINKGKILLEDSCENILKVDNELYVGCASREEALLLKNEFEDSEFSSELENTLVIKYEKLIDKQQEVLKKAKKLKIEIVSIEKRKLTLEEVFLSEVKKHV